MEKLKSVRVVFENCESVSIPVEDLNVLNLTGANKDISYNGSNRKELNSISGLYLDANIDNEGDVARFLKYKDITQIVLTFERKLSEPETYLLYWDDSCVDENPKQKVEVFGKTVCVEV